MKAILNISNHDYHNAPEYAGLSKSGISLLLKSPAHFRYSEREETTAMSFGSLVHTAILEPEKFRPAVFYGAVRRGKEWEKFLLESQGKAVVTADELETIEGMRESIAKHETASALIALPGPVEESIFWDDPTFGFQCKCRPDKLVPEHKILIDLKSCLDASPVGFSKAAANFDYHVQAAWYLAGINSMQDEYYQEFIFIAVEKSKPYSVAVYRSPQAFVDYGREKIRRVLPLYAECLKSDIWPSYPDKIMDLNLPSWAA